MLRMNNARNIIMNNIAVMLGIDNTLSMDIINMLNIIMLRLDNILIITMSIIKNKLNIVVMLA